MTQEIYTDEGKLHIGEEKGPEKSAAIELELNLSLPPTRNGLAADASEVRPCRSRR